jgi:6-phosphogluconate dehydrogenase
MPLTMTATGSSATEKGEESMQVGMIGLGRMGGDRVRRLLKGGQECVVFDLNFASVEALGETFGDGPYLFNPFE